MTTRRSHRSSYDRRIEGGWDKPVDIWTFGCLVRARHSIAMVREKADAVHRYSNWLREKISSTAGENGLDET